MARGIKNSTAPNNYRNNEEGPIPAATAIQRIPKFAVTVINNTQYFFIVTYGHNFSQNCFIYYSRIEYDCT
jgi:hypothetical protein